MAKKIKWRKIDNTLDLPRKSGVTWVRINNYDTNVVKRYYSGFCGFWTHDLNKVEGVTDWCPLEEDSDD